MTTLTQYQHFGASHWETGSLQHVLAYQYGKAQKPISEALLLGISGGITVGYFSFAYKGVDPHVALLIRNTFDPFPRICERLGIVQTMRQTTNPQKAAENILTALENDQPAIVWADLFSLPYNAIFNADRMWMLYPIVVYGLDLERAAIADRAEVGLTVSVAQLSAARGRTKENKYQMLTVDGIDWEKLPRAIEKGIHDCISLFTENPPKGSKHNFGFLALERWSNVLLKDNDKQAWSKVFPPGRLMYAGLVSAYTSIQMTGTLGQADRPLYAQFLDEAADILGKPALKSVATMFRRSAEAWQTLTDLLLPDAIPPFAETRALLQQKRVSFRTTGSDTVKVDERLAMEKRLHQLRAEMETKFPLSAGEVQRFGEAISAQLLHIRDLEQEAIRALDESIF